MNRFTSQIVLCLVILNYWRCLFGFISGVGQPKLRCLQAEREALLNIKEDLDAEFKNVFLSSWGDEEEKRECCNWIGIQCANNSDHVISLDLSPRTMGYHGDPYDFINGKISSSLVNLRYLNYLDLSFSMLDGISSVNGNLTKLRYLNLSHTLVGREIPPQFANLSGLQVLDLGNSDFSSKSFDWLSHLSSLRYLDLSSIDLSKANDWMLIISKLPCLTHLDLGQSYLPDIVPQSLSFLNSSSSLTFLHLSSNNLSASFCQWLFNSSANNLVHLGLQGNQLQNSTLEAFRSMTSLEYLDLGSNQLRGSVLEVFGSLTALEYLDLSNNHIEGSISEVFWNMSALAYLDLGDNMIGGEFPKYIGNITTLRTLSTASNHLRGNIPENIGQLSELEKLDISGNSLGGVLSETLFSNLSKLSFLHLSFNSHLVLNVSFDWIPPFQLRIIGLRDCKMAPQFPKWLKTQKNYSELDISNVGISDFIPSWFWELSTQVTYLNLSNNQIGGTIHNLSSDLLQSAIDLSSNQFEGPIPSFLFKNYFVHLSENRFSKLDSLCDVADGTMLKFLDISSNQLSGELPDCWSHLSDQLIVLRLTNNNLSGRIPISFGSLTWIASLHLGENNFNEELPSSLKNCTKLRVLDVGENKLLGPIPTWIGENLSALVILVLRSNNFYGSIPSSLCSLSDLQLLDLSSNNISGRISKCFSKFTSMKEIGSPITAISHFIVWAESYEISFDEVQFIWKGTPKKYSSTLGLVKDIDLSSNKLMGEIPEEITELIGLVSLNLSRNNLSGQIPSKIGRLKWLDALDLSNNKFTGVIPLSLTEVDRLSKLDLSSNNLSGKIPTSTQLQSFDATSYMRNPELCGAPLAKCQGEEHKTFVANKESTDEEGQDGFITKGFYVSATLGFVTAFWVVCGSLLLIKSRRHAYFKFLNDVQDWVYVMVAINKAKLLRLIRS